MSGDTRRYPKKEFDKNCQLSRTGKTQIIEDGGKPIYYGLKVRDPLRHQGCIYGEDTCMVDIKYPCDTLGVVYRIECMTCNAEVDRLH